MASVIGTGPISDEVIEVDLYIPLEIKWERDTRYRRRFLSIRDDKNFVLDIAVYSHNGHIHSLTLVNVDEVYFQSRSFYHLNLPATLGRPIFDPQVWSEEIIVLEKDYRKIQTYFGNGSLSVFLNDSKSISSKIITERVCFGLDEESNICAIEIFSLSNDEQRIIRECLLPKKV